MHPTLTFNETRLLGSLLEKEVTTPDQYPLSLNALINACNQKSNREPVTNLAQSDVQETLDELVRKHFVVEKSGYGSRVPKYQHRFANTTFGELHFDEKELALICLLFLRGPQTPGELRSRSQRLCTFDDVQDAEATLEHLRAREDGPFVVKLARQPGRREHRYAHLFSGPVDAAAVPDGEAEPHHRGATQARLLELEQRVDALSQEVEEIKRLLVATGVEVP